MPTTTETAERQDTTTQINSSQQTGSQPAAGAGGGQAQSGVQSGTGMQSGTQSGQASAAGRSSGLSHRDPLGLGSFGSMGGLGNPFAMVQSFAQEMDRLFESFGFGRSNRWSALDRPSGGGSTLQGSGQGWGQGGGLWSPQIEVSRRGNELVVCADLPGMKKEDLRVEVREDHLVLEGERRQEHQGEEGGFYRSERSYGHFYRAIPLPEGTNPDQAQASFRDGVLEVKLPLPERQAERSRRIEIR